MSLKSLVRKALLSAVLKQPAADFLVEIALKAVEKLVERTDTPHDDTALLLAKKALLMKLSVAEERKLKRSLTPATKKKS